ALVLAPAEATLPTRGGVLAMWRRGPNLLFKNDLRQVIEARLPDCRGCRVSPGNGRVGKPGEGPSRYFPSRPGAAPGSPSASSPLNVLCGLDRNPRVTR